MDPTLAARWRHLLDPGAYADWIKQQLPHATDAGAIDALVSHPASSDRPADPPKSAAAAAAEFVEAPTTAAGSAPLCSAQGTFSPQIVGRTALTPSDQRAPMIPWNPCPLSRGIRAHLAVEFMPAITWNSQAKSSESLSGRSKSIWSKPMRL
jgi:hypothetical protein